MPVFKYLQILTQAPNCRQIIPMANKVCGGLRILTSRPYALCHQSSKGAEVSIAMAPQIQKRPPSEL